MISRLRTATVQTTQACQAVRQTATASDRLTELNQCLCECVRVTTQVLVCV